LENNVILLLDNCDAYGYNFPCRYAIRFGFKTWFSRYSWCMVYFSHMWLMNMRYLVISHVWA